MTAVAILAALAAALLLPLAVAAVRQRTLVTMASRNIRRRRSEAVLVVGGALLGTAIITSSFVVGDVVEGAFSDLARTRYGPVDITLTPTADVDVDEVAAAVETARIEGLDGLLATTISTATLQDPQRDSAVPQVRVVELDIAAARGFGADPHITGLVGTAALAPGEVLLNRRTATELGAEAGDALRLHAYGAAIDVIVTEVVAEVGLAGYGGAIVAPGTLEGLAADAPATATPPHDRLLVSLEGGVFDTRESSGAAAAGLRAAVAELPDVEIQEEKAALLDDAAREGAGFTELFSVIGAFSVLAGVLLLVNLFVMLAEERKTELGMLRAVGFTRRRLTRAFALEEAFYALVSAAIGAVVGVGIGWVVAVVAGSIFGLAGQTGGYPLVVEPVSLAMGAIIGLLISLVTIWATSLRIARLNVIRAIRDLPEPQLARARTRTLVLGTVGVLLGAGLGVAGYLGEAGIPLLLGVPLAAFAAAPWLRRVLPERTSRLLVALAVLGWALSATSLFPDIMGFADPVLFVLQGVVLTAGAVSLAASLDRLWAAAIERLGRGDRGLAVRLGVAYPLARRFRTSMLLGMFSLVIFTVTILATVSATFQRSTDTMVAEGAWGFDVVLDASPTDPIDTEVLRARHDVAEVVGLAHGIAAFEAAHLDSPRDWAISGFDGDLLQHGTPVLAQRPESYPSDAAVYRAVLEDPTLAIVPDGFLAAVGASEFQLGETFAVVDRATGRSHQLTVAGLADVDWAGNGALISRELATSLLGPQERGVRSYVAVPGGVDAEDVAVALNATFLSQGADARSFAGLVDEGMGQQTGLLAMLQGFLGLGLLVGTAGLGVVMIRAVRERRQAIGVLRAMGLRTSLVRAAMLSEAGLIAVQGTLIGAVLGLITTRQLLTAFGDGVSLTVPWVGLMVIVAVPLVASLAATAWPAAHAAAVRPAVALRTAD